MIIEGSLWTTSIAKGAPVFNQMHLSLERDFEMAVIIFYFTASTKWYKETEEDDKTTITSPHTPSVTYTGSLSHSQCLVLWRRQTKASF